MGFHVAIQAKKLALLITIERHQGDHGSIVRAGGKRRHGKANAYLMAHGLIGVTQLRVCRNAATQTELFCTRLAKRRASLGHLDIDNCSLKARTANRPNASAHGGNEQP